MIDNTHANAGFLPPGYKYAHLFKRVYLGTYYGPFRERVLEVKAKAAERGAHYFSLRGYDSWAAQHKLRALFLEGKGGRAAPAGYSAHQFGLADDSAYDTDPGTPGLQPSWAPKLYDVLGEEAMRAGLHWGASYGDRPHISWPGYVSGIDLAPLRSIWQGAPAEATDERKLMAVFDYLDVKLIQSRA